LNTIDRVLGGAAAHTAEITLPVPVARTFQLHATRIDADAVSEPTAYAEIAAVVMFHDMTTAVRAEQMRVDFVNNASHELRSPLTAILGFIETLKGPAQDDAAARDRFLGIMAREAERMRRLIEDLLSLSKVEADEHVRPCDHVDVGAVVRGVADLLDGRATEREMVLSLNIAEGLPTVIGNENQLAQVFRNIIENAIAYGREHTPVTVAAEAVERLPDTGRPGVVVRVADQGKGIPPDAIPRLTERFFRVDEARSPGRSGNPNSTGLGLAIVKHIVNRHRGRLRIESELGKGSTFSVFLPSE
ncbi:MAG: ATP-binding protein, partial [Rhodospirillaceae bacterium]